MKTWLGRRLVKWLELSQITAIGRMEVFDRRDEFNAPKDNPAVGRLGDLLVIDPHKATVFVRMDNERVTIDVDNPYDQIELR